jgi:hypothetical protein
MKKTMWSEYHSSAYTWKSEDNVVALGKVTFWLMSLAAPE